MARAKLAELLKILNLEIKRVGIYVEKTNQAANEIARASANSPSQSGDREHSRNQAIITKEKLEKLEKLKDEINEALSKEIPIKVVGPCFVEVKYSSGVTDSFYLVKNPSFLTNVKVVSSESPLGKALIGKHANEAFVFKTNEKTQISGSVVSMI